VSLAESENRNALRFSSPSMFRINGENEKP
jgi:hypothetical protein